MPTHEQKIKAAREVHQMLQTGRKRITKDQNWSSGTAGDGPNGGNTFCLISSLWMKGQTEGFSIEAGAPGSKRLKEKHLRRYGTALKFLAQAIKEHNEVRGSDFEFEYDLDMLDPQDIEPTVYSFNDEFAQHQNVLEVITKAERQAAKCVKFLEKKKESTL